MTCMDWRIRFGKDIVLTGLRLSLHILYPAWEGNRLRHLISAI